MLNTVITQPHSTFIDKASQIHRKKNKTSQIPRLKTQHAPNSAITLASNKGQCKTLTTARLRRIRSIQINPNRWSYNSENDNELTFNNWKNINIFEFQTKIQKKNFQLRAIHKKNMRNNKHLQSVALNNTLAKPKLINMAMRVAENKSRKMIED